jgi:hypothetical protein
MGREEQNRKGLGRIEERIVKRKRGKKRREGRR